MFSAPSTPAVSRSSTPAPPDRDDGSDEDEEEQYPQGQGSALTQVPTRENLPTSIDDSYEPHLERADSVRLLSLKNGHGNDPTSPDANDDEVQQINSGKENRTENKPGLLPDAKMMAKNKGLNLGLPSRGTFSDAHDGQKQADAPVSTQHDFNQAEILRATAFRPPGASN